MNTRKIRSLLSQLSLLAALVLFVSCSPTRRFTHDLEKEIDNVAVFQNSFTGFALYDPVKKKMLVSRNAEKFFVPASNMKLFTFYTAQKILGDSVAGIRYRINKDSLIFSGTGDPSFLNPALPESKVYNFLKTTNKNLYYQPAAFSEKAFGPGWAWDDYNYRFSSERSQFPVFGNLATFRFSEAGKLLQVVPEVFRDSIVPSEDLNGSRVKRVAERNLFQVSERPKKDSLQKVPFRTSPELTLQLLQDTLNKSISLLPKKAVIKLEKVLYSVPTDSLYKKMLQDSDNFIAEQLLLLASGEITDSLSSKTVIELTKMTFLKDLQDAPQWVDASGLSRYNLVTPRSIVALLEKIKTDTETEKLFNLLPAGGKSGTIKDLFNAQQPYVYAKSGSMSNIYNLSGYLVTKSGKILIFSFMNNNFTGSSSVLKAEMEHILMQVRKNF